MKLSDKTGKPTAAFKIIWSMPLITVGVTLFHNRYVLIFALALLLVNIAENRGGGEPVKDSAAVWQRCGSWL